MLDSKYAVTTHVYRLFPCRSVTMRGNAVPTIVWSSAARNKPSSTAPSTAFRLPRESLTIGPTWSFVPRISTASILPLPTKSKVCSD